MSSKNKPALYIFSGLPGVGKSSLSKLLASYINATYIQIDLLEYHLNQVSSNKITTQGYELGYHLAEANLKIGNDVVADSCNPVSESREAWESVARKLSLSYINIEVRCSNLSVHQKRVEKRLETDDLIAYPSWQSVKKRHYEPWDKEVIGVDNIGRSVQGCFELLLNKI